MKDKKMEAVLINVVETVRNARKLAKTLGNLNACEFEIVDALQGKTDEEILEIIKEDVNSNVNKELGLLFTIKNNMKTLNSFHFELYNKEFRIIKDSDIFDILLEEIEDGEILPYFNADFLSRIISIDKEEIIKCQQNNCYDILMRICTPFLELIAKEYKDIDGYEHHFGRYDGTGEEFEYWDELNKEWELFHIFQTN